MRPCCGFKDILSEGLLRVSQYICIQLLEGLIQKRSILIVNCMFCTLHGLKMYVHDVFYYQLCLLLSWQPLIVGIGMKLTPVFMS